MAQNFVISRDEYSTQGEDRRRFFPTHTNSQPASRPGKKVRAARASHAIDPTSITAPAMESSTFVPRSEEDRLQIAQSLQVVQRGHEKFFDDLVMEVCQQPCQTESRNQWEAWCTHSHFALKDANPGCQGEL